MTVQNARRKLRREFKLETLERREVLTGAVSAAHVHEAIQLHASTAVDIAPAPGGTVLYNANSIYDVQTNYIGGTLGLQAFVDGLYINVLGRAPDAPGATYWLDKLESGMLPSTVTRAFVSTANSNGATFPAVTGAGNTYTSFLGGPTGVQSSVVGRYVDVLNRAPDAAGEAAWINQIEMVGGVRPGYVTEAFLKSPEFVNSGGTVVQV